MLRGFTTISYWADDLEAARDWYAELLGVEPYFRNPGGYVEFRIGDSEDELGIIDARFRPPDAVTGPGGVVMYWHVDDVDVALSRLTGMGATIWQEPVDRGEGYITAAVIDPFGNVLGVMYNPHYLEVLAR